MTDIATRGPPPAPPPHAPTLADDSATDYSSEVDTALNTPTSWTTEHGPHFNHRWSLSSALSATFSRPNSMHNSKRNSEFFAHRRSTSPKKLRMHRTSMPPIASGKLFHKRVASNNNDDIIQEEQDFSTFNAPQQQQYDYHQQQQQQQQKRRSIRSSQHQRQQHYRMQYHESMRVQRLLGMVYQFQMSTAHSEEALSAFCKQLQTYLESWADLKRDKRHVVRHTNMSILCNGRSSVVRSKRCRHIMDDHSRYRHQKQHQRSHDLEEPQPQNTFDALEPQIQQKLDSVKEPLLVRIRELELALKECERERSQVEQELNAVQNQFSQAQRPADSSAPPSTSSKDENDNDEESSEKVEEQSAFKVEHHNQLDTLMSVRPALTSERYADEQSREQERQAYHEARAMLTRTQTTIAELELRLEVANSLAKKQRQQQPLPTVVKCDCRQTIVAERDAQIQNLESTIQHYEGERQTWEQQAAARYFQEKEAFKVQVSRQVRELAGALAEQECQNDVLEKRRQEDALTISRMETLKRQAEEKCQKRLINWEAEEKSLRMTVATLEAKIVKLEQDSLVLYAKNLKLAHQLGQWAP